MPTAKRVRFLLFGLVFSLVVLGLVMHSYPLLVVMAIAAIILGVIGEKLENAPTEPFKKYNDLHHHKHRQ